MKNNNKILQLPDTIKVDIKKGESGCYLAYLPEYDIFTESDSLEDIDFQINDLIYTFFDVPKKLQGKIWFRPTKKKSLLLGVEFPLPFKMFLEKDLWNSEKYV